MTKTQPLFRVCWVSLLNERNIRTAQANELTFTWDEAWDWFWQMNRYYAAWVEPA